MGLGEMRRGRVDTLYSERESIRFVVKRSCFFTFLQRVSTGIAASSGSPGRAGRLRLLPDCPVCHLSSNRPSRGLPSPLPSVPKVGFSETLPPVDSTVGDAGREW